ncbi:prepilin-type N-terminal cleavage/methylation domain-containing protein, partial [bacterium]|nr:prepilin-type N-terminal cleavage/methylation domain-containing protein [bacterium]
MKRLAGASGRVLPVGARRQHGYTIVELLMATTLTLILMGVVATIFAAVSRSVHQSRAVLEMNDRMRA